MDGELNESDLLSSKNPICGHYSERNLDFGSSLSALGVI